MKNLYKNYMTISEKKNDSEERLKKEIENRLESETHQGNWEVEIIYNPRYKTLRIEIGLRPILNYEENEIPTGIIEKMDKIIGKTGTICLYSTSVMYEIEFSE